MADSYQTKKGTQLPIMNLKGKPYLQVAYRVVWFREEFPLGKISTECIERTDKYVIYKAHISVPDQSGNYVTLADGVKREDFSHFSDAEEKASTGSIGRALALLGFGTQFCADELDEGKRIVDAPTEIPKKAPPAMADIPTANLPNLADKITNKKQAYVAHKNATAYPEPIKDQPTDSVEERDRLGEYVIPVTKKLKGKKLKEVTVYELQNTLKWFDENAKKPLHNDTLDFYEKASAYLDLCEVRR